MWESAKGRAKPVLFYYNQRPEWPRHDVRLTPPQPRRLGMHDRILVTGGAGFIGSNFILQQMQDGSASVVNFDKLTYAGNLHNLESIASDARYQFVQGDVTDRGAVRQALEKYRPQAIVHFAAESHVDRSIRGPEDFINTNINGTFALLEESAGILGRTGGRRPRGLSIPARFHGRSLRLVGAGRSTVF